MERLFHYSTVTEAVDRLKQEGFTTDFNIRGNCLVALDEGFQGNEFEIVDVYRYEGDSDPADEATGYAITSRTGLKGVLVTGYGNNSDTESAEFLLHLHYRAN